MMLSINAIKRLFARRLRCLFGVLQYRERLMKFSMKAENCTTYDQFEALITKSYHSIEKGLSYQNIKLGFGTDNIIKTIALMKGYEERGFPLETDLYQTARDNIEEYIELHRIAGYDINSVIKKYSVLGGSSCGNGGTITISKKEIEHALRSDFNEFSASRHSVRDFSHEPVDIDLLSKAVNMCRRTPSACNRQGWRVRIISDKQKCLSVLKYQNGNRGFGENIDKLILITACLQYFDCERETFQPYIDGGLYSMNMLYCLHYFGIASVPLSASLTSKQEKSVRDLLCIPEKEVFIMFIGCGNYLDVFKVPKSTRREVDMTQVVI